MKGKGKKKSSYLLEYSPNACTSGDWVGQKSGDQNSIWVCHMSGKCPSIWAVSGGFAESWIKSGVTRTLTDSLIGDDASQAQLKLLNVCPGILAFNHQLEHLKTLK